MVLCSRYPDSLKANSVLLYKTCYTLLHGVESWVSLWATVSPVLRAPDQSRVDAFRIVHFEN